jgi:hypothetical protein
MLDALDSLQTVKLGKKNKSSVIGQYPYYAQDNHLGAPAPAATSADKLLLANYTRVIYNKHAMNIGQETETPMPYKLKTYQPRKRKQLPPHLGVLAE